MDWRSRVAHEALRQVREEFNRHPAITSVVGLPHDTLHTELRAEVEPLYIGANAPRGTLTVRWLVSEPGERPRFVFHYADESGFDCGWHRHEQDHVDGWAHYQERSSAGDAYSHEAFVFESVEPARVVWDVLEDLCTKLQQ